MAVADPSQPIDLTGALHSSDLLVERSKDGRIPLLANDSGERILALFSSVETLERWPDHSATFGALRGQDAFGMAVSLQVDAVVIDPAGPVRLEFSLEDARRLSSKSD